ncbi:hypothetical protein ACSFBX_29630 [Variovorax sp. RB2P76]|uniref:hypothetical protein n=1 Tax=unclassified Variovorax TaxID=663243 RepID=UPI003F47B49E
MRDITRFAAVVALPLIVCLTGCKPEASATPTGASSLVVPEKQQIEKLNAHVVAYNKLLKWHSLSHG